MSSRNNKKAQYQNVYFASLSSGVGFERALSAAQSEGLFDKVTVIPNSDSSICGEIKVFKSKDNSSVRVLCLNENSSYDSIVALLNSFRNEKTNKEIKEKLSKDRKVLMVSY